MRVVRSVCDLCRRELRLPVTRAHPALIERLAGVSFDDLRKCDNGAFVQSSECGICLLCERPEFDEVGCEDAIVAEELLAIICVRWESKS